MTDCRLDKILPEFDRQFLPEMNKVFEDREVSDVELEGLFRIAGQTLNDQKLCNVSTDAKVDLFEGIVDHAQLLYSDKIRSTGLRDTQMRHYDFMRGIHVELEEAREDITLPVGFWNNVGMLSAALGIVGILAGVSLMVFGPLPWPRHLGLTVEVGFLGVVLGTGFNMLVHHFKAASLSIPSASGGGTVGTIP